MNISLFIIGTELTRGIIKDQHTSFLASEVSKMGYKVLRSVVVPDDGSVESVLEFGLSDSDVLLVTGGLGPTSDDKTRKILSSLAGRNLVKNQDAWNALYKRVGERIWGSNEQQAYIPEGFEIIPNPNGTACGFYGKTENDGKTTVIISLPGPPAEMQPMFLSHTRNMLSDLIGYKQPERDEYSSFLISEAKLDELCAMCSLDGVEWEDRFQQFRISLYIAGCDPVKRKVFAEKLKELCGPGLLEDGDFDACQLLQNHLVSTCRTIAVSEEFTGGLFSKLLTDSEDCSLFFRGAEIGTGVSAEDVMKKTKSDLAVSITEKNEMEVQISLCSNRREPVSVVVKMNHYGRDSRRRRFVTCAMILTRLYDIGSPVIDIVSSWKYI